MNDPDERRLNYMQKDYLLAIEKVAAMVLPKEGGRLKSQ